MERIVFYLVQLRGLAVGADALMFLHAARRINCVLKELGVDSDADLKWVAKQLKEMVKVECGIGIGIGLVFFVFDGCESEAKQGENANRTAKRKRAKDEGRALLDEGDLNRAESKFMGSSKITFEDKLRMMDLILEDPELRDCVIPIVAPFQADSFLRDLSIKGIIKAVYGEDLDFVAGGCKNVLTLGDFSEKCARVVDLDFLFDVKRPAPQEKGLLDFRGFTYDDWVLY